MSFDLLLGRDGLAQFPLRTYRDVDEFKTIMSLSASSMAAGPTSFDRWVQNAVGMIEQSMPSEARMVVVYAGKTEQVVTHELAWVPVTLRASDGALAPKGLYYVRFESGWSPSEMVVEAGDSIIPLRFTDVECSVAVPGMVMGAAGAPMVPCSLNDAKNSRLPTPVATAVYACLLYTSPSPRDLSTSRMPSSA